MIMLFTLLLYVYVKIAKVMPANNYFTSLMVNEALPILLPPSLLKEIVISPVLFPFSFSRYTRIWPRLLTNALMPALPDSACPWSSVKSFLVSVSVIGFLPSARSVSVMTTRTTDAAFNIIVLASIYYNSGRFGGLVLLASRWQY